MPSGEQTYVVASNLALDGGLDPPKEVSLWGHLPAHCNIPMRECIPHCLPATAGKCTCSAHTADECICHCEGWQDGNAAFCQITVDICYSCCCPYMLFETMKFFYSDVTQMCYKLTHTECWLGRMYSMLLMRCWQYIGRRNPLTCIWWKLWKCSTRQIWIHREWSFAVFIFELINWLIE